MKQFDIHYEGKRWTVFASNFEAARRLGTRKLANELGVVEPNKVAVVDPELSAGYHTPTYLDVTLALANAHLDGLGDFR